VLKKPGGCRGGCGYGHWRGVEQADGCVQPVVVDVVREVLDGLRLNRRDAEHARRDDERGRLVQRRPDEAAARRRRALRRKHDTPRSPACPTRPTRWPRRPAAASQSASHLPPTCWLGCAS
jgi:hypothetical protein